MARYFDARELENGRKRKSDTRIGTTKPASKTAMLSKISVFAKM